MPIRVTAPSTPSTPPPNPGGGAGPRLGLSMTWTGWDGSEWNITDWKSGVFLTNGGVRGLNMPPHTPHKTSSPGVAGSQLRGFQVNDRAVFWPIFVFHDGTSQEWIEWDRKLWRTWQPNKPGVWTVRQPNGIARHLDCVFVSDGDHTFTGDPARYGWQGYGVTMEAPMPYWRGDPIPKSWGAPRSVGMFDGPGVLNISPGSTTDNAVINNPGDVDAYMIYHAFGPMESLTVGIEGDLIEIPFEIESGKALRIDTRPTELSLTEFNTVLKTVNSQLVRVIDPDDSGLDRTDEMGEADFVPVPPGEDVTLSINIVAPGVGARVDGELTPLYYRAW